jgi:hypothetical protein
MGQFVATASVLLSTDNLNWIEARNVQGNTTFTLNSDQNTKVSNRFSNVMFTRYIRVIPITVGGHASMRLGILLR